MSALSQLAGRRILFLNWRDLANPLSGGAEAYAEQIALRFSRAGAAVTLFTSEYQGSQPYDWKDSYLVIRKGGRFGVYLAAARHLRRHRRHYDAVIDFQNGIPFFAPAWAGVAMPVVCVVHHVHQKQFDTYFRWPVNYLGRFLEGRATRRVYRHSGFVAVSPSTRAEMRHQLGISLPITIVPNGIAEPPEVCTQRSQTPSIAAVTRLVPHKRLHLLIEAVPELLERWPGLHVVVAGSGPERAALLTLVRELGLERTVALPGRVSEEEKARLLTQAWLTVAPSAAEGWGLTVLEANAVGTPAVAYDVPGLRDSVRDGVSGWLVPDGESLGKSLLSALDALTDPGRRMAMARQAMAWAGHFSWDSSAERLAGAVLSETSHRASAGPSRRRAIDLAAVAEWSCADADQVADLLRKTLRVTDVITSGPRRVQALLTGCDEVGAAACVEASTHRAGHPATGYDFRDSPQWGRGSS